MPLRYDWYQSDSKVVITVLIKNANEKKYTVEILDNKVKMIVEDYSLEIQLHRPIIPEKSSHKATPSKVEINLAKTVGERWERLEKQDEIDDKKHITAKTDWDKLAADIVKVDNDEAVGEENLNKLFQQIYSSSNEETRRAMNKSFTESGGTVLSTNWKEVGEKPVEVKPPDGAEYKNWSS